MFDFLGNLTIWHYLIVGVAALGAVWFFVGPKIRDAVKLEIGQSQQLEPVQFTPTPAMLRMASPLTKGFQLLQDLDALYEAANVPVDERRKLLLDGVARLYGPSEAAK
jgi:hypothetical protein